MSDVVQNLTNEMLGMEVSLDDEPLPSLPLNVWLKIFGYLRRNDLDNCELVCRLWRRIIYNHSKFLPKREIEYLIISSARCFSIQICSANKIKLVKFPKYFTAENLWTNINDRRLMSTQTIYKDESNEAAFKYDRINLPDPLANVLGRNEITKRNYKISTPPVLFFKILRSLLRYKGEINHLVFRRFTFTDSFLEKCMFYLDLPIQVKHLNTTDHRRRDGVSKQGVTYINFITDLIQEERLRRKEPQPLAPVAAPNQALQPAGRPPHVRAMIDMMRNRIQLMRQVRAQDGDLGPDQNFAPDPVNEWEQRLMALEQRHQNEPVQQQGANQNNGLQARIRLIGHRDRVRQQNRVGHLMDDLNDLEDEFEVFAHFERLHRGGGGARAPAPLELRFMDNAPGPANPRPQQPRHEVEDYEMEEALREIMRYG